MSKRLAITVGAVILAVAILTSCAEAYQKYDDPNYIPSSNELTRIAIEWPDGDPLKPTAQAVALKRYDTAQAAQSQADQANAAVAVAEATRQAAQDAAQRQYVLLTAEAQMTEDAHRREMEQKWQWATQQAANATQVAQATAMAVAVEMTAQAMAIQATAQQRAYEATATADAMNRQATATTEARNRAATATAQYKADVATATQAAWEVRTTTTAECWQATRQAEHIVLTRQAEKREEVLGYGRDYGIPLVLLVIACGVGALVVYGIRQYAGRPVVYPRSVLGDAEPVAVPVQGGGYTFVDLDRQPGPAITVLPSGQVSAPLLRSAGQEERTTARDQLVDAMNRPKLGAGHKGGQAPALPVPPTAPAPGLRSVRILRRLDQAERAGFIAPPLVAALAADWEEEQ